MATSGGGTGTPVTSGVLSGAIAQALPVTALTLSRYAQIIGYDECAFWGVRYDGQEANLCATFWTESQRRAIAEALGLAQQMLEDFIQYPLMLTWITGTLTTDGRFYDEQPIQNRNPFVTRWGMVQAAGVQVVNTLQASAAINYNDASTAVVGPLAVTISSTDEVRIYYAGSNRLITPSKLTYVSGNLTIEIPRCRLVKPELFGAITQNVGIEKGTVGNFVTSVDVKRVYNDPSTNAQLVTNHPCNAGCSSQGCTQYSDAACMVVNQARLGIVEIYPATYANSTWARRTALCCDGWQTLRLNYQAGVRALSASMEQVLVRLAHSLMPEEPCSCATVKELWKRDRQVPEILSQARLQAPFGTSEGAYFAYQWAKGAALLKGGLI